MKAIPVISSIHGSSAGYDNDADEEDDADDKAGIHDGDSQFKWSSLGGSPSVKRVVSKNEIEIMESRIAPFLPF